jgi:hypothetical protein
MKNLKQNKELKGICKNCWNKGYSTEMIGGTVSWGDFPGDKDYHTKSEIIIHYCKCGIGKQLKSMIEQIEKDIQSETLKKVDKLILEEILIAQKEGKPTSRLTSLSMKLEDLKSKLNKL